MSEPSRPEVSVVIPCLNEEKTIGVCIKKAASALRALEITGEIVVSDNGSSDRSVDIAKEAGARIVHQPLKGYGNALIKGFECALGKYIIMGDGDDSYNFEDIGRFIFQLQEGADVVVGDRFHGNILPGAMPWKNRYFGNPVLSALLNLVFNTKVSDCHSGMRGFRRDLLDKLQFQSAGMEFASEMLVKAAKLGCKIVSIPIVLYPAGRQRPPHLRPWRDGWRHTKFILLFSPVHLFLIPGIFMMACGFVLLVALSIRSGPVLVGPLRFDTHWSILGSLLILLGYQVITTGVFARIYSITHRFQERDRLLEKAFKYMRLETGLAAGALLALAGFGIDCYVLFKWFRLNLGALNEFRTALLGSTLMVLGVQTFFNSLFLSILGDAYKRNSNAVTS